MHIHYMGMLQFVSAYNIHNRYFLKYGWSYYEYYVQSCELHSPSLGVYTVSVWYGSSFTYILCSQWYGSSFTYILCSQWYGSSFTYILCSQWYGSSFTYIPYSQCVLSTTQVGALTVIVLHTSVELRDGNVSLLL